MQKISNILFVLFTLVAFMSCSDDDNAVSSEKGELLIAGESYTLHEGYYAIGKDNLTYIFLGNEGVSFNEDTGWFENIEHGVELAYNRTTGVLVGVETIKDGVANEDLVYASYVRGFSDITNTYDEELIVSQIEGGDASASITMQDGDYKIDFVITPEEGNRAIGSYFGGLKLIPYLN